jgi:hypothetical protein
MNDEKQKCPLGCVFFSACLAFSTFLSRRVEKICKNFNRAFSSRVVFLLWKLFFLSLQKFSGSFLLTHTPNSFLFKGSLCGREREREREPCSSSSSSSFSSRRRRFDYRDKSNDTERERIKK